MCQGNLSCFEYLKRMGRMASNNCHRFLPNSGGMWSSKVKMMCLSTISKNNRYVASV